MRGLVKVKFPKTPKIENDPVRRPVNRQAAFIVRPARDEFRPMPSDPDLTDRKVVMEYLKERKGLIEKLSYYKRQMEIDRAKLKKAIEEMERDHKPREVKQFEALEKLTTEALEKEIDEVQKCRDENLSSPDCVLKIDFLLRKVQDRIRDIISKRQNQ